MRKRIEVTSEPAIEPVTLIEARNYVRISHLDDDTLLESMITASRVFVEQYLNRKLITQTIKLTLDLPYSDKLDHLGDGVYDLPSTALSGDMPRVIKLYGEPIQSITSVVLYDQDGNNSTYSASNYYLDTGRLVQKRDAVWGVTFRPEAAMVVTYVAGYGSNASDVPGGIKQAILAHVQYMYDQRMLCDMPQICLNILQPYKIYAGS